MLHTFRDFQTLSLQQIRQRFGGKALGLYEAYRLGIPIPTAFMISAQDHESFLKTDPPLDEARFLKAANQFIENRLGPTLKELGKELYAVRSSCQAEDSANHSFAGIFETYLNIPQNGLIHAVARVWYSPLRERSQSYSSSHTFMGVLIQPMIQAKFAGICFTVHPSPTNLFENQSLVVEYAAATGEQVVQGEVTPFRLSGTPDLLSAVSENGWMDELLGAIFDLKKHYHCEADIEFAIDANDSFWLLQQRPISKVYRSQTLDLSSYKRMYKRSLLALDVELLIDGCSQYLAPYLEVPISLERWMIMTTQETQELWVDAVLNETVLRSMMDKIEHSSSYLPRLEARYADHYRRLKMGCPLDRNASLHDQLFQWFEWMIPFTAHYYVPMFAIEALYTSLLRTIRSDHPESAEKDLFDLASSGIGSMVDLLNQELRPLKTHRSYRECASQLEALAHRFGFLKCRQPYENPYSPQELFEMIPSVPDETPPFDQESFDKKVQTYFQQEHLLFRFERLREWMRIRNQEMEYLLFAYLAARPLIDAVCKTLSIDGETFWRSSKASLLLALRRKQLQPTPVERLSILRVNGQTVVSDQIEIRFPEENHLTDLKGRTVYGKGILEAFVRIAFTPEELTAPNRRPSVLVTGMTTPDFVPKIRKHFDALITDEGGILCHAAIIAREVPIPCLVGTGRASQVLPNGALVRIDFDRGEVEILNE